MTKIVVIGGGISGIIAAIKAKNNENEVIVLEASNKPLKKLLITGNGKCNFFNDNFNKSFYYSNNEEYLENLITNSNKDIILSFFESIGIVPKIKNGYYYPASMQAISVKNALMQEVAIRGIEICENSYVKEISKQKDKFFIKTENDNIICDKVIISTGSCAYPKTGSDGSGYNLVKELGHSINKVLPALTALHGKKNIFKALAGVRCEGKASLYEDNILKKEEHGEIQFTNYGISGICIFNLSGLASKGLNENRTINVFVNFVSSLEINTKEEFIKFINKRNTISKKRTISELLDNILNYKLSNVILEKANIDSNKYLENLNSDELNYLGELITNFKIEIIGTNSFDNSQVCQGGVPLTEINSITFESKIVPNLYLTGELLDVYGQCGGYNIAFATLSGIIAGTNAGENND